MTETLLKPATRDIVIDEIFPHAPRVLWAVLTSGELMSRWMMKPTGFIPKVGNRFTFQTTPAGAWDGTIRCQVLELTPFERFSFSWTGGDAGNSGYGSKIDTIVSWTLSEMPGGTRLVLRHSGFELPKNDTAYTNLGKGWRVCLERVSGIAREQEATGATGQA
jgi:uncharacterized protein YndB with AHSA1/START domain